MSKNYDLFSSWEEFKSSADIYNLAKCSHCGTKKYDENKNRRPEIRLFCKFKTCVQYFCNNCKRWDSGWGRIYCPCEMKSSGHGTYDEFSQPSGKKKVRTHRKWKAIK